MLLCILRPRATICRVWFNPLLDKINLYKLCKFPTCGTKKGFSYRIWSFTVCDWISCSSPLDLMSFDDVSSTSEKLSHPTANRPKMPGRRLPGQFGASHSVSKIRCLFVCLLTYFLAYLHTQSIREYYLRTINETKDHKPEIMSSRMSNNFAR